VAAAEAIYELDRYEVLSTLGKGGFGSVFLARHRMTGREVALKVCDPCGDPELVARALNEARVMATTRHPSLVEVFDCGSLPDGRIFVAMERVEGRSLEALLDSEGGRIAPERAVHIAVQVLSALDAVHARAVIHRDIKPGNVLVRREADGRERAYVIDFGISKVQSSEGALRSQTPQASTVAGMVLGTPGFMAPEQLDARSVDVRADVYGVGALLFCAISGRPPYEARTLGEWLYLCTNAPAPALASVAPWVSPALAAVIDRSLARDRDARPPSARAMAEALLAGLHGSSIATDRTVVQSANHAPSGQHSPQAAWAPHPSAAPAAAAPRVTTQKLPPAAAVSMGGYSSSPSIGYAPTSYVPSARGAAVAPSVRVDRGGGAKSPLAVVGLVALTAMVTAGAVLGVVRPWERDPRADDGQDVEFVGPSPSGSLPQTTVAPTVTPTVAPTVPQEAQNAQRAPSAPSAPSVAERPRAAGAAPASTADRGAGALAQRTNERSEATDEDPPSSDDRPRRQRSDSEDVALLRSSSGRLRFVSGRPVGAVDMSSVMDLFRRAMTRIEGCHGGTGPARVSLVLLFRSNAPPMLSPASEGGALARCAGNAIDIAHGAGGSSHGGILTDAVFEWRGRS